MMAFPEPWIVDVKNVTPGEGSVLLLGCDREYGLCLVDGELHWWRLETITVRTSVALYNPVFEAELSSTVETTEATADVDEEAGDG